MNLDFLKSGESQVLKRLWWPCIIRDRILALGMKRSIQITKQNSDFCMERLTLNGLAEEVKVSKVWRRETKLILIQMAIPPCFPNSLSLRYRNLL
jgi:hypothetical protein